MLFESANDVVFMKGDSTERDWPTEGLTCLKGLLKDRKTMVNTRVFIDKLIEKELITPAEEKELKRKVKKSYVDTIDSIFFILREKNPHPTFREVRQILIEMQREDIFRELHEKLSEFHYSVVS